MLHRVRGWLARLTTQLLHADLIILVYFEPAVTEYEEHSKTGDLETYSGSGQHKNSANKERKSDTTRKVPPNQLTIPKAREQYHRGQRRHLSDSSVASYQSINENQGLTPDPYGACHEDTRATPYYQSARRLHPQQPSSRDQYGR